MKEARIQFCFLCFKGDLYVFGGRFSWSKSKAISKCEKYSIDNNIWTEISPMPSERNSASCCLLENKYVYVFGGEDKNEFIGSI